MMRLERQCSSAAHWAEQQYQQLFVRGVQNVERFVLVVEESVPSALVPGESGDSASGIVGFLVARHGAPEWELENIVVASRVRRKGLGKRLLDALLERARETNSAGIFLEVRESNAAARTLYERARFEISGRRKSYYADPPEDAVLYRRDLG